MKQAPYTAVLSKSGEDRHIHVCVTTPTHIARGRKTLQMYGFPIQTYGKTSKCHNFNSECVSARPFKLCPQVLPVPPQII